VVLANSEFRHELEANLDPFKGLLLGLFFITVGAGINFSVLGQDWTLVLALVAAVFVVKAGIVYLLAWTFGIGSIDRWLVALGLAQAGEFGFVLVGFSLQTSALTADIAQIIALVIAISMVLSPVLFVFFDKVLVPHFERAPDAREYDVVDTRGRVLIAGIGRFGQIINRLLVANGIETVILDHDAKQVDNVRMLNIRSYFGDATRPDLLQTAGIDHADLFVIAIDDRKRVIELVKYVKKQYPQLDVLVRAYDQVHYYQLKRAGADHIIKETYHSALDMGCEALRHLGFDAGFAQDLKNAFIETEEKTGEALYQNWLQTHESRLRPGFRQLFMQQEAALREAMQEEHDDNPESAMTGIRPSPED
jgi:voltage-gated potassium channel Kch